MKRALVISAGGSKGAYAVGVLQQLKTLFPTLQFDIIVGTSAGALITPLAAVEELTLLRQVFTSLTTEKVIRANRLGDRLNEKSIYTVEPLYQLLKTHIPDTRYNAIQASGKNIYIITTCLQTAAITVYTNNTSPKPSSLYNIKTLKDAEHLRLAVLASACQPVLMTPVKIDGNYATGPEKNFQYVDGGLREYAGIQLALDAGADEVFSILLSPAEPAVEDVEYKTLFPLLQRAIGVFNEEIRKNDVYGPEQFNKALEYIGAVKEKMKKEGFSQEKIEAWFKPQGTANPFEGFKQLKIHTIRPKAPLGGGPGGLFFIPAEMQAMMEAGSRAADEFAALSQFNIA